MHDHDRLVESGPVEGVVQIGVVRRARPRLPGFRARDPRLSREVAVKLIATEGQSLPCPRERLSTAEPTPKPGPGNSPYQKTILQNNALFSRLAS
jgi:hypothetical protein